MEKYYKNPLSEDPSICYSYAIQANGGGATAGQASDSNLHMYQAHKAKSGG
ncbi:MAG: hypothetical protein AAGF95_10690 [Chloroflexota bacterium]